MRDFHVCGHYGDQTSHVDLDQLWLYWGKRLLQERAIELGAFVLMKTHWHAIMSFSGEVSLIERLCPLQSRISLKELSEYRYFLQAYRYVYRNPVSAGLVSRVEEYRFSTLRQLLGQEKNPFPLIDRLSFAQNPMRRLAWLNEEAEFFYSLKS